MAGAGLAIGYLLSTPSVAERLMQVVETSPSATIADPRAGAIVVLRSGVRPAPEYGGRTVDRFTLEHLRHAALLHRATGRPVLVIGGDPYRTGTAEAQVMGDTLARDFGVPVAWIEPRSDNTLENARFTAGILHATGIDSIHLVTHAWHMPRARYAFEQAGLRVPPAPTGYTASQLPAALAVLPDAGALHESALALRELVGLAWYRLIS